MLVSIAWIEKNYEKYNELYFGNVLPKINFKISRAKKTWGYASYRYNYYENTVTPVEIVISNYYDSPEDVKLTTLLHEMIHIYDYTINPHHFVKNHKKVRGYDAHGAWFRSECVRLAKYGWDIEKHVTAEEKACSSLSGRAAVLEQNKIDQALLCVIYGTNGYNWVIKTNEGHVKMLLDSIKHCSWKLTLGNIKTIKFYKFVDPALASRRSAGKSLRGWKYTTTGLLHRLEELKATEVFIKNASYMISKITD